MKTLAAASAVAATPGWLAHAAAPRFLTPDFSPSNILREVAGLRPWRRSGVRIESEALGSKLLVHNYGHGGSGFTLCWGSAEEAANLITGSGEVAVLGGGIIGLTTAKVLSERGYKVRVYTAKMSPDTTSDLAGAQWSPSFCPSGETAFEQARFNRMLAKTYRRYQTMAGSRYAVYQRANYIPDGAHDGLQDVPAGILEPFQRVDVLPFGRKKRSGVVVPSWLIEPPVFMPALVEDLRLSGVEFIRHEFHTAQDIASLRESIVVNCCGLESARLFGDADMIPMKGQLILLKNTHNLDFVALHKGYTFCRNDAIVIGGSYQKGVYDLSVDPKISAHILKLNRDFFFGA